MNSSGRVESIDGIGSLNIARNIVYNHNFSVSPPEYNTGMSVAKGVNSLYYGFASFGYAVAMVPAVLFTKIIYLTNDFSPAVFFPLESDYLLSFLASFVNPVLTFFLFLILYKLFKLISSNQKTSLLASILLVFTTNILPLAKHSFAHILFMLLAVSTFYCVEKYIRVKEAKYLFFSGLLGGLLINSYNQTFVFVLGAIFLYLLFSHKSLKQVKVKEILLLFCFPILFFLYLYFLYNKVRFGSYFNFGFSLSGGGDLGIKSYFFEGFWGLLFSPGKSIFVFSPLLILAVYLGFKTFRISKNSRLFIGMFLVYLLFFSKLAVWSGDLCYGPRYLSVIIPFAGLVLVENWKNINKFVLTILALIGFYIQLVGIVIPYQIQYPPYDLKVFQYPSNADREVLFQAYAIGQFIPRFSPPYRLKGYLLERLSRISDIVFLKKNPIDFVSNVYYPEYSIENGVAYVKYRHAKSDFIMYAFEDINFRKISLNITAVNQPLEEVKICIKNICQNSYSSSREDTLHTLYFSNIIKISKGDYVKFEFNQEIDRENLFEMDINSISFDERVIDLDSVNAANKDGFFTRGTYLESDNKDFAFLWELRNREVEGLVNNTADFWWIKTHIYYNLPGIFRYSFWIILTLSGACVCFIVRELYFNRKSS